MQRKKNDVTLKKKELSTAEDAKENFPISFQFMTAHWITTLKRALYSLARHTCATALVLGADVLMLSTFANPINAFMILPTIGADIWYISKIAQKDRF